MMIAFIQVLLSGFLWGLTGIYVRYFNHLGISSVGVVWIRVASAFVVLFLFLLIKDRRLLRIRLRDIWCFAGTGICSIALFNYCYFTNITETSLSIACTMLYLSPVFALLYSALLFRERVTVQKIVACIVAVIGCCMVTGLVADLGAMTTRGLILGVLSGAAYGLYGIFSRFALSRGYHALTITTYTFLFAVMGIMPFTQFKGLGQGLGQMPPRGVFYVGLMLVTSVLPYLLYTKGLERISPSVAAVVVVIEPVCAMLVGAIFFEEKITWWGIAGMCLVIGAIVLLNVNFSQKKGALIQ